jgi:gluconolactonase
VVRYEHDGSITLIADKYQASASTRPTTSSRIPTAPTGSPIRRTAASSTRARLTRRAGRATRRAAQAAAGPAARDRRQQAGAADRTYRVDPSGRIDLVSARTRCPTPTALLLPRLQEALRGQHRQGSRRYRPGGKGEMYVFDVGADNKRPTASSSATSCGRRQVRARWRALRRGRAICGARPTPAATSATAA